VEEKELKKIFSAIAFTVAFLSVLNLSLFAINYRRIENYTSYKIAKYIRENTGERDTIYILGDETIIYFLADRRAPTKFFDWLYSSKYVDNILETGESVLPELKKSKPKYVVYYNSIWLRRLYLGRIKDIEGFIFQNYHVEKNIDSHLIYKSN